MPDFRSALYLGITHPHRSLHPWNRLTLGLPAALEPPEGAVELARLLAKTLGHESATLGTSTLHIYWDLFDALASERPAIYMDEGLYPVVRWGVERVAAQGVPAETFRRHDPDALEKLLNRDVGSGRKPMVVTDGLCPATGQTAPLARYLKLVRKRNGYLVVDDTQALGLLGRGPKPGAPYGFGGAGSPAWHGVGGSDLIVGSSLAKAFGVPMAVLGGSAEVISRFEERSSTRVHCSPPSSAVIAAGGSALAANALHGDRLRAVLLDRIRHFRHGLRRAGLSSAGRTFPTQTLNPARGADALRLYERLESRGVRSILRRGRNGESARLSFLITAAHTREEIDQCLSALEDACFGSLPKTGSSDPELRALCR